MKRIWRMAALLVVLPAMAASAAQAKETLVAPDLPGFVVGHAQSSATGSIREEIPQGQTVQNWKKMVTTQWFRGLARRVTPTEYANIMLG
jgi:hypothetical protein